MLHTLRRSTAVPAVAIAAILAHGLAPAHGAAIMRISEVMSNSLATNTPGSIYNGDWFELTNFGDVAQDVTGWKFDDSSFSFASSVALSGVTSVAAGESVVFIENVGGTNVADFKTFWGLGSTMQVGYYGGSGVGLSSAGDGVVVFTADGTEINRVSFGAAPAYTSFFWTYDASGILASNANGTPSVSGSGGAYTTSLGGASANVGSPGIAVIASVPNLYWTADGATLGGSGTWNASAATWSSGSASVVGAAWTTGKTAIFLGASGTVTLDQAILAGGLSFATGGFTLAGAGTSSLNVPTIEVVSAGDVASVSARLVGTGGLSKGGAGLLVVSNTANAYTGITSIVSGTLQSGAANVIPDASPLAVARFAGYDFAGFADTVGGISGLGSITNIGGLSVNVSGTADVRFDGSLTGTGSFIVDSAGTGRQVLNSTTQTEADGALKSYSGATIVRRGTLAVSNGVNRVPAATSGVEVETDGRLELTSAATSYTFGPDATTVVTLRGGSLGQEADEDVTLTNAVHVASSSSILVKNTTTPTTPTDEEITLAGTLSGSANTILSLAASNLTPGADAGRVIFTSTAGNTYAGTVSVGQNMTGRFNGSYPVTPVLLNGGTIDGTGSVKSVGGVGLVSPGNSPGVLTTESVDAASGIDFSFEFTGTGAPTYNAPAASVNDVLRLTAVAPFSGTIDGDNVVNLFLARTSIVENDVFQGGFFTTTDQSSALSGASRSAWVLGDGNGTDAFLNGQGYYSLTNFNATTSASWSLLFSSVATSADFGSGPVSGFVTQVTVVPEPGSFALMACGIALAGWAARRRPRTPPAPARA